MRTTKLDDVYNFIERHAKLIDDLKVTSMKQYDFNNMEGYQVQLNVKIFAAKGYNNCLIKVFTNSTYVDEFYYDDDEDEQFDYETAVKQNIAGWLANALYTKVSD